MRDPARIPKILERLRKVWEAHPDLRLGQLVVNAATSRPHCDPFYIEDDSLIDRVEALEPIRRAFESVLGKIPDIAPDPADLLLGEQTSMNCESNGCTASLPPRNLPAKNGEASPWWITEVPPHWCIRYVENDEWKTARLVVLCPVHSAGVENKE